MQTAAQVNPRNEELVKKRALTARTLYNEQRPDKVNVLLYGDFGTGKTTMISTAPKPIWIDSFDPGGTTTRAIQPLIDKGDIVVTDFAGDKRAAPVNYRKWENEMKARNRDGLFHYIGTYCIDSLTKWADALMLEIVKKGGFKNEGIPGKKDYLVQQNTAVDELGQLCALPCNFLATGHIGWLEDEITGAIETGLLLAGKLSGKVPLVFDEKWLTRIRNTAKETLYTVQTRHEGMYKAETRMGGGIFEQFEEPNFTNLLRKAGKDAAAEDKPSLFD